MMKFKRLPGPAAAVLATLMAVLCFGAAAADAYPAPRQQPAAEIKAGEDQGGDPGQGVTAVAVDVETVKGGAFVWLGEFSLARGDKISYDVSAEKGNGLKTGFAAPEDDPLNRTYFSISNRREDGTLATRGSFTVEAPAEPGQYRLFILATDGDLTNVTGNVTIEAASSLPSAAAA